MQVEDTLGDLIVHVCAVQLKLFW